MKKMLYGTAAALAMAVVASPASAQSVDLEYAGADGFTIPTIFGPVNIPDGYEISDPGIIGIGIGELGVLGDFGTRYFSIADAPGDSETATPTVSVSFALSGTVNPDCSFYSGNDAGNIRDIDFGVIGVRTGDNENVANAFTMVGDAEAFIQTLTAGCNTNNTVTIAKDDVRGMVNNTSAGYDTDQFQANIPYEVTANWTGVGQGAPTGGTGQTLQVDTETLNGVEQQGAWRSNMNISIVAPAIAGRGLVAGDYEGTVTLTLAATI